MSRLSIFVFASLWLVASFTSAQQLRLKRATTAPRATTVQKAEQKQTASGGSDQQGQAPASGPGQSTGSAAGAMVGAVNNASASTSSNQKAGLELLYPRGGEELVSGTDLEIKWKNTGNQPVGVVLMMEHKYNQALKYPIVLSKSAPAAGPFRYKLPLGLNSRDGWQFKIALQQGDGKVQSGPFAVYPQVDLRATNIKIRNKKKSWALKALKTIATGGLGNVPGMTEIKTELEVIRYERSDKKAINRKDPIIIEYDLENRGTQIPSGLMSKVTIRLLPGNAELNSAGFSHDRVIPGRKYHQKGTIKAKDWDLAPGRYVLEIAVDPQNNAHEPEELRANNVKTVEFTVK
jgi:hypothetical protein